MLKWLVESNYLSSILQRSCSKLYSLCQCTIWSRTMWSKIQKCIFLYSTLTRLWIRFLYMSIAMLRSQFHKFYAWNLKYFIPLIHQVRGALETIVSALTPIDHVKTQKNEVQPALMNTDLLSREADSISLLLSLLVRILYLNLKHTTHV